jgi:glycosyltransferase involved in cell wall biosynthesis
MSKILLIGPKFNKNNPSKVGGIVVLFEDLIIQLKNQNIKFKVIDTNKENYKNKLIAFISIYFQFLINLRKADHISIHGTVKDYIYIAPLVLFISKILRKKVSLRKFAGNFKEVYLNSNLINRSIIIYILRNSDTCFFETKYLVEYFKKFNINTFWFPNVRNKSIHLTSEKFEKRFIFIGNVSKEKGIDTLFDISNSLSKDIQIDIYGTLVDFTIEDFEKYNNLNYKGTMNINHIQELMSTYNVLILPSKREGYPGVLIEAFSVGLPAIISKLEGILEMTDNNSSVFIEPNNSEDLLNAINLFSSQNYLQFRTNSLSKFDNFDSSKRTDFFLEKIGF